MTRIGILSLAAAPRRPRSGEERVDLRREDELVAELRARGYFVLPAGGPFHEEDAVVFDDGDIDRLTGTFHLHPVDLVVLVDAAENPSLTSAATAQLGRVLGDVTVLVLGPASEKAGDFQPAAEAASPLLRRVSRDLGLNASQVLNAAFFEHLDALANRGNSP